VLSKSDDATLLFYTGERLLLCDNVGNTYGEAVDYDVGQDYFRFAPRIDPRNREIDVRSITERERERERERDSKLVSDFCASCGTRCT